MRKIVIGILPTFIENKESPYFEYYKFVSLYSKKIIQSGAVPVGLLIDNEHFDYNALEICDAFIIPGGNKVNQFVYETIYYAIQKNKPLVGICMGADAIDIFSRVYDYLDKTEYYNKEQAAQIYKTLKEENEGTLLRKLDKGNIHNNDFLSYDDYDDALHEITIEKNP